MIPVRNSQSENNIIEEKLSRLRTEMKRLNIDVFLVPVSDRHQTYPLAEHDRRLQWLTGFSGSAGLAIVGHSSAALLVDGRYTIQAKLQTNAHDFEIIDFTRSTKAHHPGLISHLESWFEKHLDENACIGIDPWLHSNIGVERFKSAFMKYSICNIENPIDLIWDDQPQKPHSELFEHDIVYAGQSRESKLDELSNTLSKMCLDWVILTSSDSIAWLLNIRGSDVVQTPVKHAYAFINKEGNAKLFVNLSNDTSPQQSIQNNNSPLHINDQAYAWLGNQVTLLPMEKFEDEIKSLQGGILVPNDSPHWVVKTLTEKNINFNLGSDPCNLPQAKKNEIQIKGFKEAHVRDGLAMVEFLAWLDSIPDQTELDEMVTAKKLLEFRQNTGCLHDISFDTISSTGPNGAINHYRVTEESNRKFSDGDLYLVDSGGQYVDGTTDVTRTIPIGTINDSSIRTYTLVLRGLIALSSLRWPYLILGRDLDIIARQFLWRNKLNYAHATGHGVGHFLSVHEGPVNISPQTEERLEEGMVLSIEPGCYVNDEFGIRLENLVVVKTCVTENADQDQRYLQFDTLTLVPFDRRLINTKIMSPEEINWLNEYHSNIWEQFNSQCSTPARKWLECACNRLH